MSLMINSMRNYHNLLDPPPPPSSLPQINVGLVSWKINKRCFALSSEGGGGGGHDEYWMEWSHAFFNNFTIILQMANIEFDKK